MSTEEITTTRRDLLAGSLAIGALAGLVAGASPAAAEGAAGAVPAYELPPLPYAYDALEPHLDATTMRLHHDIHHRSYVTGLNNALQRLAAAREAGELALVKHWSREVAFHGGGHALHVLFWTGMRSGGGTPSGALEERLRRDFGSVQAFKNHFAAAAAQVEGSGWAVLAWETAGRHLLVAQAEKHELQAPATVVPLLAVDVWEHAYYLRYQNRRADYVAAWWNVVDWDVVARRLEKAMA